MANVSLDKQTEKLARQLGLELLGNDNLSAFIRYAARELKRQRDAKIQNSNGG